MPRSWGNLGVFGGRMPQYTVVGVFRCRGRRTSRLDYFDRPEGAGDATAQTPSVSFGQIGVPLTVKSFTLAVVELR